MSANIIIINPGRGIVTYTLSPALSSITLSAGILPPWLQLTRHLAFGYKNNGRITGNLRDVLVGKIRDWAVVGNLPGVSGRGWRDIVVLTDLPSEIVLAVHIDTLEVAVACNKAGKTAQDQSRGCQGSHLEESSNTDWRAISF